MTGMDVDASTDTHYDTPINTEAAHAKKKFDIGGNPVIVMPDRYAKDNMGIYLLVDVYKEGILLRTDKIVISYTPFDITEQLENPDTKETFFRLKFDGKEISFSAGDLSNKKGIIMMAGYGVNTVESNAKLLCRYIMGVRGLNHIPISSVYDRFGWKDDGGFVLGNKKYTNDGVETVGLNTNNKQTNAIHEKGDTSGWIKAINGMMKYKNQRFKMYIGVAPMILKVIREANIILSDTGKTSIGKTTSTDVVMSMFGNPDDLKFSGKTTQVGIERTATLFCDMPIYIDEAHNMEQKHLESLVYIIFNGVSKLRGAKMGGTQDIATWKTAALMTSENPIITESSNGGIGARIIEISRSGGLGATDVEAVRTFKTNIKNNYGLFAPILIRYIIQNKDEIIKIHQDSLTITRAVIGKFAFNQELMGIAERTSNIYASILTAGRIFEEVYGRIGGEQQDPNKIVLYFFETLLPEKESETLTNRGLKHILSWISANRSSFLDDGSRITGFDGKKLNYKILGDITPDYYNILPHELRYELEKAKFNMKSLINDFIEHGYLKTGKDKTRGVRIEGVVTTVYSLIRSEVDNKDPDSVKKVK